MKKQRTERERWDLFIEKHEPVIEPVMADAFFWCSGANWETRLYRVVLLAKKDRRYCGLELKATTPVLLMRSMREAGYRTTAKKIASLCEAAPISPRPRKITSAPPQEDTK